MLRLYPFKKTVVTDGNGRIFSVYGYPLDQISTRLKGSGRTPLLLTELPGGIRKYGTAVWMNGQDCIIMSHTHIGNMGNMNIDMLRMFADEPMVRIRLKGGHSITGNKYIPGTDGFDRVVSTTSRGLNNVCLVNKSKITAIEINSVSDMNGSLMTVDVMTKKTITGSNNIFVECELNTLKITRQATVTLDDVVDAKVYGEAYANTSHSTRIVTFDSGLSYTNNTGIPLSDINLVISNRLPNDKYSPTGSSMRYSRHMEYLESAAPTATLRSTPKGESEDTTDTFRTIHLTHVTLGNGEGMIKMMKFQSLMSVSYLFFLGGNGKENSMMYATFHHLEKGKEIINTRFALVSNIHTESSRIGEGKIRHLISSEGDGRFGEITQGAFESCYIAEEPKIVGHMSSSNETVANPSGRGGTEKNIIGATITNNMERPYYNIVLLHRVRPDEIYTDSDGILSHTPNGHPVQTLKIDAEAIYPFNETGMYGWGRDNFEYTTYIIISQLDPGESFPLLIKTKRNF